MKLRHALLSLSIGAMAFTQTAWSDDIQLDKGVRINDIWLYPSLSDPSKYRYLPQTASIVTDEEGAPRFSMTFYIREGLTGDDDPNRTITDADGGALVNFLVVYETDPAQVVLAQEQLRERFENDALTISGPITFEDGQFSVISSILTSENVRSPVLLSQAGAPTVEGSEIAVSANLEPEMATALLGSLQTATPDLSVTFDMAFQGLTQAYNAEMIIDWSKVGQLFEGGAGGTVYFVSADVQAGIERAFQDGSITLNVNGDDAPMDALIAQAQDRALQMLFTPVSLEDIEEASPAGVLDELLSLVGPAGALSSGNTTGFGAYVNFRMKDIRREGQTRLSLNKRASVTRRTTLTANLGDYLTDAEARARHVTFTPTTDPAFAMRKVYVSVDGRLVDEIGEFVNSVQVTLRKRHEGGRITTRELLIDASALDAADQSFGPLTYTNPEREDLETWLGYEVRTIWSFKDGGRYETDWAPSEAAMINLTTPYHYSDIIFEGDLTALQAEGLRVVVAEIDTDFFGRQLTQRRMIQPTRLSPGDAIAPVSITLPDGEYSYGYIIRWVFDGGRIETRAGTDDLGFIFLDELPAVMPAGPTPERTGTND